MGKYKSILTENGSESEELFFARIQGKLACFARPEFKCGRVSSIIPSHSALNGILSSFCSHKGISYSIKKIGLLFYPRLTNIMTNEVSNFNLPKKPTVTMSPIDVENRRTQINTQALFDVDYWISFRVVATSPENVGKYSNMFNSRLPLIKHNETDITRMGGIWNHSPYLGMREYSAKVERIVPETIMQLSMPNLETHEDGMRAINLSQDLGLSFFGTDYNNNENYFFPMRVERGVTEYPSWSDVKRAGITIKFG